MSDVEWAEVWPKVEGGCTRAGVRLTPLERMTLYESWDAAYSWPEVAA